MKEKEIIKNFVKAVKAENGEMPDEICIRAFEKSSRSFGLYMYLYIRVDYKGDVVGMWKRNEDGKTIRKASISEVLNTIWEFYKDDFKEVETVDPRSFFE